jgi:hypothetical protein
MASAFGLTLTHRDIEYYRERLVAGKSSRGTKPLLVPITDKPNSPFLRLSHMLPAVARKVVGEWGQLKARLDSALVKVSPEHLQGGPGGGSPTKRVVAIDT